MSNESKALPAKQPWTSQRVLDLLLNNALIIIMAFAVVYIAFKNPNFIKPASLINILSQTCAYLPVALGVGGCIVLTGTDLSAGRIVGLTACISASLLQAITTTSKMWENITPPNVLLVLALAMVIGALFGAFNGFFVAKFKLHPFIVTLATQLIVYTILLLYVKAGNNKGMAISGLDKSYSDFITGSLPFAKVAGTPIPNYVWIALVCTAVMWFIWNKTTFGKNMFALGANEEAARVSGVNVFTTTILVFALAGAMYAVTGFIEGARVASNTANTGLNYEADAIAACVIGGVSFVGGIGKIRGIVIGVVMLRLIFVGLNMVNVPQDLIYLVKGAIILFACALDMRIPGEKITFSCRFSGGAFPKNAPPCLAFPGKICHTVRRGDYGTVPGAAGGRRGGHPGGNQPEDGLGEPGLHPGGGGRKRPGGPGAGRGPLPRRGPHRH